MLLLVVPAAGTGAAESTVRAAQTEALPVSLVLDEVSPSVVEPGAAFTLRGTVRNAGSAPVALGGVRAATSYDALDTRSAIAAWASGDSGVSTGRELGSDPFDIPLAPGASTTFVIPVAADVVEAPFDFGTLPLSVEVLDDQDQVRGRVRSFLPWYAGGRAEVPLHLSWVVPLTVPPEPALSDPDDQERTTAWLEATGPGSTPRTWLEGLAGHAATFVVDPALLAPVVPQRAPAEPDEGDGEDDGEGDGNGDEGEPTGTGTGTTPPETTSPSTTAPAATTQEPTTPEPTPEPTPAVPTAAEQGPTGTAEATAVPQAPTGGVPGGTTTSSPQETTEVDPEEPTLPGVDVPDDLSEVEQAQVDLETALSALPEEQLWWLPVADPDLAAFVELGTDESQVADAVNRQLPDSVLLSRPLLESGRSDVAWPAWTRVQPSMLEALRSLWPQDRASLGATLVPSTALSVSGGSAAGRVSVGGEELTLLGLDTTLSGLLAGAPPPERDGETVQRLVAETLAVYQQSPATERTLVLSPPRGTTIDHRTLRAVTEALESSPWLEHVPAGDALEAPGRAQLTGTALVDGASGDTTAYPVPQPSPLNASLLTEIDDLRTVVSDIETILTDDTAVERWRPVLDGLVSTRWRLDRAAWRTPLTDLQTQVDEVLAGVQVNPTTVNFLAEEGLIQLTVVNTLDVAVEDLRLNIEPGNGRIRVVEEAEPITIGADSRATVQFRARAVAAGEVPVRAYLSTPTGLVVGDEQVMEVRVQPAGQWIYWLLGGVAGVILVLGLARALRRPADKATQPPTDRPQEDTP
jgi:hypothetical protein